MKLRLYHSRKIMAIKSCLLRLAGDLVRIEVESSSFQINRESTSECKKLDRFSSEPNYRGTLVNATLTLWDSIRQGFGYRLSFSHKRNPT